MNAIGLSTAVLYPTHLTEDALTTIARLGFQVVEVFLQAGGEYTPAFGTELDRRRRDLGLRVHSLHIYSPYFDLWAPYPRMIQETRDRFQRLLEIAAVLEARAAGVMLCIENVSWCYLRTCEQVTAMRQANLPVGFTLDTFQAGESGTDPVALIHAMDSRLTTAHLADYAPGGPRHLPPGEGTLDWPAMIRAFQTVGYDGPLILEPAHVTETATLLRARDFLQQVWFNVARTNP